MVVVYSFILDNTFTHPPTQHFTDALGRDAYCAVAFFQRGVCQFDVGDLPAAEADFQSCLTALRSHPSIDYKQLGLR